MLAFWSEQKNAPEVIRAKNGEEKIPSLVYLGSPRQYGHAVIDILLNAQSESEQQQLETYSLVIPKIKMELIDNINFFTCDDIKLSACEIVRDFLSYLKQYAQSELFHDTVEELHISHPVIDSNAFTESARKRLEEAAHAAGFTVVELIEEPVAAAYGYIAQGFNVGENVLVYDIGGGTLDLAYLSRDYKGVYHPVKTSSVPNCAGSNFDQLIYKHVASKIPELEYDENNLSIDVLMACQKCKETLSRLEKTYWKGRSHSVQLTRSEFENLIRNKIHESIKEAEDIFTNLKAEGKNIDTFLLIGGSSRIPLIHNEFNRLYEEERISCKPLTTQMRDVAVALGTVCDPDKLQTLQLQQKEQEQSKAASANTTNDSTNTTNKEPASDPNNASSTSTSDWIVGKPIIVDDPFIDF